MDRYKIITSILFAAIGVSACKGQSEKEKVVEDFPSSQTKYTAPVHTSQVTPDDMPDVEEPIAVTAPESIPVEPMEPSTTQEFLERGNERYKANEFAAAAEDFAKVVEARPNSLSVRLKMARALLADGNSRAAREHAEMAVELNSESTQAWNTMGRVELAEGDNEAAISSFERSTEANPDNSYAWNNLGFVLIEEGQYEAAAKALEQATSGAAPAGYMWNNLGMAYEHLDQISEARAAYRQAADGGSSRALANFTRLEGVVSLDISVTQDDTQPLEDSESIAEASELSDSDSPF